MRQFPPPPSFSHGIADKWVEFLRSFRLIRWELLFPPLRGHSEVALNWLLAGGRQTTNVFQQRVCAPGPWCLHITLEAWQLTVGCGWEPCWWTGHDTYWHPLCPLHSLGEGNAGSFLGCYLQKPSALFMEALCVLFGLKYCKWFPKSNFGLMKVGG